MTADIPEGFRLLKHPKGFIEANGPFHGKWDGTHISLGLRVEMRHCNISKICHGGMLATLADMSLAFAAHFQSGQALGFVPTINLACDYLAPAPLGSWIEGRGDVLRATKNLLFMQGIVAADGKPALRMSGIFKVLPAGPSATPPTLESFFEIQT